MVKYHGKKCRARIANTGTEGVIQPLNFSSAGVSPYSTENRLAGMRPFWGSGTQPPAARRPPQPQQRGAAAAARRIVEPRARMTRHRGATPQDEPPLWSGAPG